MQVNFMNNCQLTGLSSNLLCFTFLATTDCVNTHTIEFSRVKGRELYLSWRISLLPYYGWPWRPQCKHNAVKVVVRMEIVVNDEGGIGRWLDKAQVNTIPGLWKADKEGPYE